MMLLFTWMFSFCTIISSYIIYSLEGPLVYWECSCVVSGELDRSLHGWNSVAFHLYCMTSSQVYRNGCTKKKKKRQIPERAVNISEIRVDCDSLRVGWCEEIFLPSYAKEPYNQSKVADASSFSLRWECLPSRWWWCLFMTLINSSL